MDLQDIIKKQNEFDKEHGFKLDYTSIEEKYLKLTKELVGMFGEIGEFSNIVKKINLQIDHNRILDECDRLQKEEQLREELIDIFIYWLRMAKIMNIDIDIEYNNKLKKNVKKYEQYE